MQGEEFKIKTEVELDTSEAESKLKSFVGNNKDKKIPLTLEAKLDKNSIKLQNQIESLNKKLNDSFQIKSENLQSFDNLDKAIKNIKENLKGVKNLLKGGQINIFNMNGLDPKIFDDSIKHLEKYIKKVESGYEKIQNAKDKVDGKPKSVEINLDKANAQADKFANKMDALKLKFNNLKLKAVGIDNLDNVNKQLDELKSKARESALNGFGTNTPEIDRDVKILNEKLKLFKQLQSEYEKFEKAKIDLGKFVDEGSVQEIEGIFKEITNKIASIDDLEIDFNLNSFITLLSNLRKNLGKDLELELSTSKAEEDFLKFFNKLDVFKFKLKELSGLDLNIIGKKNFENIEKQIEKIKTKAGDNLSKGKKLNNSEVDLDVKNLQEQARLLKQVQAEYKKFQSQKDMVSEIMGEKTIKRIEKSFKDVFAKISSMENLELDFDLGKLLRSLSKVDEAYELRVEADKAEKEIDKFENKLKQLKYKFDSLDLDFVGSDNFSKVLDDIERIKKEASDIFTGKSDKKLSDLDLEVNNLKEQQRLLKAIQKEYSKFNNRKDILSQFIDEDTINDIERKFREAISNIVSMKNLDLDFDFKDLFDTIKKADKTFELEVETSKAIDEFNRLESKIEDLKYNLKSLDFGLGGYENVNKLNAEVDSLMKKNKDISSGKIQGDASEINNEINLMKEKQKVLKQLTSQYKNFKNNKKSFSEFLDKESIKKVEDTYKEAIDKAVNSSNVKKDKYNFNIPTKRFDRLKEEYNNEKIRYRIEVDAKKAEDDLQKFFNKIDSKKVDIKKLNSDLLGEIGLNRLNHSADTIKVRAELNKEEGYKPNTPAVERELKNLDKQIGLIKTLQTEYEKFVNKKAKLGNIVDKESLDDVENYFKDLTNKILSIDDLDIRFDFKNELKEILNLIDSFQIDIDVSKAREGLLKFENSLDNLKYKFKSLNIDIIGEDSINKIESQIAKLKSEAKERADRGENVNNPVVNKEIQNLKEQEKLLKKIQSEYNRFITQKYRLGNNIEPSSIEDIERKFKEAISKVMSMNDLDIDFNFDKIINELKSDVNKLNPSIDTSKMETQLDKFENKLEVLKYKFKNLDINIVGTDNIEIIERKIENIKQKARENIQNGLKLDSNGIDLDLKNLREQEKLLRKLQTQYNNFNAQKINFEGIVDSSLLKQVDDAFKDIFHRVANMDNLKLDFNADSLLNAIKNVNRELKVTSFNFSSIQKVADDFKSEIANYTIGEMLGETTVDFARDVGQAYMELDRSMREIKKVADPSDIDTPEKLQQIKNEAISIAKEVGMASADVQSSIASALQAGVGGMKDSIEVAKQSMILANVGDMTQDSASQAINTVVKSFQLSPLKSYQLEVDGTIKKTTELKNAMDLMNFAGNNYAIGTDGIAEAMKRGGAVLASYNVSLADSVGLITATNEALQNPERVGNGLKTIAINLAGMKTNAQKGTLETNKTAKALKEIANVDVFKNEQTGELKNMVEILDEVQGKWGELSDAQQKALSESIAGKLIAN